MDRDAQGAPFAPVKEKAHPRIWRRCVRNHLGVMKAVLFLALAPAFALLSFESLSKLWGYQDSPSWIYIAYGSVAGLLAVVCLALAVKSLRRRCRH